MFTFVNSLDFSGGISRAYIRYNSTTCGLIDPHLRVKISKIFIYSIAFLISLDHSGYDVTALIAGMGIAGIAVSLAAKDSMANAIAGIFFDPG